MGSLPSPDHVIRYRDTLPDDAAGQGHSFTGPLSSARLFSADTSIGERTTAAALAAR
jgi:hypothetical protein